MLHALPTRITKADDSAWSKLEALAAKLQPAIAKAMLAALEKVASLIDLDAVAKALEAGRLDQVMAMLGGNAMEAAYDPVRAELRGAVDAGAMAALAAIPSPNPLMVVRFDSLNPNVVSYVRNYTFSLIREVTREQVSAVRQTVTAGLVAGKNPRAVARDVKQTVGLTDRQAKAVLNFRRELETFHARKTAAGWNLGAKISRAPGGAQTFAVDPDGNPLDGIMERRLRDFRFDRTLANAMKTGKPLKPEQIDKMVEAYQRKYLQYRSQTIARTEAIRSLNAGQHLAWEQAVEQGVVKADLIRRRWVVAKDERTCPTCRPIPRMNQGDEGFGIGVNQEFRTPAGPMRLPPAHPNCRCTVFVRVIEESMVGQKLKQEWQWPTNEAPF